MRVRRTSRAQAKRARSRVCIVRSRCPNPTLCRSFQVINGLRIGGLREALSLVAEGKASPDEFKVGLPFQSSYWHGAAPIIPRSGEAESVGSGGHTRLPGPLPVLRPTEPTHSIAIRSRRQGASPRLFSPQARRASIDEVGRRYHAWRTPLLHGLG